MLLKYRQSHVDGLSDRSKQLEGSAIDVFLLELLFLDYRSRDILTALKGPGSVLKRSLRWLLDRDEIIHFLLIKKLWHGESLSLLSSLEVCYLLE